MTNDIEQIIENMTPEQAEYLGRFHEIRRISFEMGLLAERELLKANALRNQDRWFFNRQERRRLTVQP